MKLLIAVLFASLIAGCAGRVQHHTEVVGTLVDCPLAYPVPKLLAPVKPANKGTHWELSHADYIELRNWVIEDQRYLQDVRTMVADVEKCHDDHNQAVSEMNEPLQNEQKDP